MAFESLKKNFSLGKTISSSLSGILTHKERPDMGIEGATYRPGIDNKVPQIEPIRAYGGLETKKGFQRDHFIPFALGGTNLASNVRLKEEKEALYKDNVARYLINEVKKGNVSVGEAQNKMFAWQDIEIPGQKPYNKELSVSYQMFGLKPAAEETKRIFKQTGESIKSIYKDIFNLTPVKGEDGEVKSPKIIYDAAKEQMTGVVKDYIKRGLEYGEIAKSEAPTSAKIGAGLKVVSGAANVAFLPITTLFSMGEQIPAIGTLVKLIVLPFAAGGDIGGAVFNEILESLPLEKETKDNLMEGMNEIGNIAGMIAIGGTTFEVIKAKMRPELEMKYGKEDANTILEIAKKKAEETIKESPGLTIGGKVGTELIRRGDIPKEMAPEAKKGAIPAVSSEEGIISPKEVKTPEIKAILKESVIIGNESSPTKISDVKKELTNLKSSVDDLKGNVKKIIEERINVLDQTIKSIPKEVKIKPEKKVQVVLEGKGLKYEPLIKESGLAKSVKAKAIQEKVIYGFDKAFRDLPEYQVIKMSEQAKKATEFALNNFEEAKKVAMGEKPAPPNIFPESVYAAVLEIAIKNKDANFVRQLGLRSELVGEATLMGQRIKMLDAINPDSPIRTMQELQKFRESKAQRATKGKPSELAKDLKKEGKKINLSKEDLSWSRFLESIKC